MHSAYIQAHENSSEQRGLCFMKCHNKMLFIILFQLDV